jgi:tetratricopeptide (TPR) repeat protein
MSPSNPPFYKRTDWIAGWITFAISLIVYTLTLQPTVGLEDSGELIVASDFLGVPHPPGYPIWTLLTWFFQWIFHAVSFHGQPNPAWGVNFFSAFAGAGACGIIALLISRSGADLLSALKKESTALDPRTQTLFCATAGIAGGLLLAFGQGMWSQAVIAEVYTLNIFFQSLVLAFLYRWIRHPEQTRWLLLCGFVFGLGITNHQTLLFMGLAIAIAVLCNDLHMFTRTYLPRIALIFAGLLLAFIGVYNLTLPLQITGILLMIIGGLLIRERFLLRDFLITGSLFILLVGFNKVAAETPTLTHWMWIAGPDHPGFWCWTAFALLVPTLAIPLLPNGRTVGITFLLIFLGLSFYFYMPFSSDQNPPINWGYPRTWEGFMHAITRGQYERVTLAAVFTPRFLEQIGTYLFDLRSQFYAPIALLATLPLALGWRTGRRNISWLIITFVAFLSVGLIFMILQNPKTDIQNLFIGRVQYIQSHAIYVLWLGYGLLLLMASLQTLVKNNPLTRLLGTTLVLLLPFTLIYKNYNDPGQLKVVGGAEQNGHDFGWQFGNWQLRGIDGIRDDFRHWYPDPQEFQAQWDTYPCEAYPPPMQTNAIFFGGTDPGRFVPTYMIYSAKVRPDIYLITQNALADNTYMNVMRDLYGDQIWVPTPRDTNQAFQEYVQGVQSGRIKADASLTTEGGRVQVQGVAGVMKINALLCKQLFQNNQHITETQTTEATRSSGAALVPHAPTQPPQTRAFYIEESYPMPWMYPYLTPHGLILKLNNQPTPITPQLIADDTAFWNWYTQRLTSDPRFIRDIVARKSFSKLRTAIAALYNARGFPLQAEAAYRQAIELYDLSPEANFRLANLLASNTRFDEALSLIETLQSKDPKNAQLKPVREQLIQRRNLINSRTQLEAKLQSSEPTLNDLLTLQQVYNALGEKTKANALINTLIQNPNIIPDVLTQIIDLLSQQRNYTTAKTALNKLIQLQPNNLQAKANLAVMHLILKEENAFWHLTQQMVKQHGNNARHLLNTDKRFQHLKQHPQFKQLTGNPQPRSTFPLSL